MGDYEKAATQEFMQRLDLGYHRMEQKQARDDLGPGHYIRDAPGFVASGHLDLMKKEVFEKSMELLGHMKRGHSSDWNRQRPRDNIMYHIGDG